MSDTPEWPTTAQAVKEMMTEVCDKNLFDSGGAYGYAYERRANCDKEPEYKIHYELLDNGKLYIEVTKSMYWHLVNTCQYRHDLTVMLDAYADLKDERYGTCLGEDFFTSFGLKSGSDNTCNTETMLDGTFLFTHAYISNESTDLFVISTHNGCDVRSGYSSAKVFESPDAEVLYGLDSASLMCHGCDTQFDLSASGTLTLDSDQFSLEQNDDLPYFVDGKLYCPTCRKPLEVL